MLQNSFYAISGTFYTLLNNTDLYLSYFIQSYVFLGHNDGVEWGLTVPPLLVHVVIERPQIISTHWELTGLNLEQTFSPVNHKKYQ